MQRFNMNQAKMLRQQGHSIQWIADELGKSARTIHYYLAEPDRDRKKRLYPSKLDPFKDIIRCKLEEDPDRHRGLLFEHLQKLGYRGGISILRDYARMVSAEITLKAVIRYETEPGYQAQVDWKELGKQDVNGKKRKLYAFTMVFGYSRAPFVMHTHCMDQATLHLCHVNAFEYFGGVPREILYDNMKTAFIRDIEGVWKPNKNLLQLAAHYGFRPRRCRVRRPQTKGKVERFISYYGHNFWPRFKDHGLSLDELDEKVLCWIKEISLRKIQDLGESRSERFKREQQVLIPLPMQPFDVRRKTPVKVSRESMIHYLSNWYSVPPRFLGKTLELRVHPRKVMVQLYGEKGFIREFSLLSDKKHQRIYLGNDQAELLLLWNKQNTPKRFQLPPEKRKPDVEIRSPQVFDRLIGNGGAA